jgi:DNA-binding LacI/PurR family transcriptional regulator
LDGLRDAISDAGIPFDRSLLVEVPLEVLTDWGKEPQLHRSIEQLLQRADRPSAILCHHEGFAMRAYRVARQLVAKIPDDLSVVGIGNIPESEWMEPPLAIIGLPAVEMGRVAMEMLLQRISDPRGAREHRVLPATWVGRESVGSPKQ